MVENTKESKSANPEKREVEGWTSKHTIFVTVVCMFVMGVMFVFHEVELLKMSLKLPR